MFYRYWGGWQHPDTRLSFWNNTHPDVCTAINASGVPTFVFEGLFL